MKMIFLLPWLALTLVSALRAEEKPKGIPYNSVNLTMKLLDGRKFEGVECVPFLVRTAEGHPALVPAEADFRIVTWEGETVKLKCEPIDTLPADELVELREAMKKEKYTHVLWMPKGVKKYLDGAIHHSLPKGAVIMSQAVIKRGKIRLAP